ncbi:MAG: energy-coupling factor ABC transporter permease [Methanoregula sp.]|jgi:cobalt/nickel transport system permease protein|uniref:energy-coupling factor ABC transporter permease n=1 Tax=Methanoregula sp. TaxID=2052170 RepID=UPI003C72E6B5
MHIMEGFLPWQWCVFWYLVSAPFLIYGIYRLNRQVRERRETLSLLAVSGAFIFLLSSLKMPSPVVGSCSHPTGTGLSTILFGPFITCVLSLIVLIFQALFMAHGGITTLGANVFSMGIAGPLLGYAVYRVGKAVNLNIFVNIFLVTFVADLFTYVITSIELAAAFPATHGGFMISFATFFAIYAVTQVPLAILEGLLIALVFKYIVQSRADILVKLKVLTPEQVTKIMESFK